MDRLRARTPGPSGPQEVPPGSKTLSLHTASEPREGHALANAQAEGLPNTVAQPSPRAPNDESKDDSSKGEMGSDKPLDSGETPGKAAVSLVTATAWGAKQQLEGLDGERVRSASRRCGAPLRGR